VKLARKYWPTGFKPVEVSLHLFCDASDLAFCSVAYIRSVDVTDRVHVSFVMARGRVVPSKTADTMTLPRMELQGAVLASRLCVQLKQELRIEFSYVRFWSDSPIVLSYLSNQSLRLKTFVSNRVAEILSVSKPDMWGFVPGVQNPSDAGTRTQKIRHLTSGSSNWLVGPEFLWNSDTTWPGDEMTTLLTVDDLEVRLVNASTNRSNLDSPVINPCNVSTLSRLLRITAYCLRFCYNCRKRTPVLADHLSVAEIRSANTCWIIGPVARVQRRVAVFTRRYSDPSFK
jgi:hypothetical protein